MKLDDLKVDIAKGNMHYHGVCHDCGVKVFVGATLGLDGAITISGGAVYKKNGASMIFTSSNAIVAIRRIEYLEIGKNAKCIRVL